MSRIEVLKRKIIQQYRLLPMETEYGAVCYQGAVTAGQAGPYPSLHLLPICKSPFLPKIALLVKVKVS